MKKSVKIILPLLVLLFLGVYAIYFRSNSVLPGYIDKVEFFDEDGFQDYTDYCKYIYDEDGAQKFYKSGKYHFVKNSEIDYLKGYFENLEL